MSSVLPFDPNKPLFGFTARFPHAKRRIHVFADEQFVYFRPKNAPEDWWGAFFNHPFGQKYLVEERRWNELQRRVEPSLRGGHFFRSLLLPDPRAGENRMWRVLWRPDFGYVVPVGQNCELDFMGAFFWPRPTKCHLRKTSTDVLLEHFKGEWRDPQSDVRAALPWCDITIEEREILAVKWKLGNLEQMRRLVHAAVQLLPIWESEYSWDQRDVLRFSVSWDDDGQKIGTQFPIFGPREFYPKWKAVRAVIERTNQGSYDLPNGCRCDWILPWLDYNPRFSSHRGTSVWIEILKPTQHERLEAALFLRDWLSQNAPDLLSDWFPQQP